MAAGKPFRFSRTAILVALLVLALLSGRLVRVYEPVTDSNRESGRAPHQTASHLSVAEAFRDQLQEVLVEGSGTVVQILPHDNQGSRHQRLIVRVGAKQTILIAHNIDIAPRIPQIAKGDVLGFRGRYVYNDKGGIVHWTHRDPRGEQSGGWLIHNDKEYK